MKLAILALALAQTQHQHHPPLSANEYAKVLEDPKRDEWQKPHEVIMALKIKDTGVVADIGAGSGYFTRRLARHATKVYAVDIDQKLLDIAMKNAPKNIVPVLATPDDPKLAPASVDLIFICDVLHHIENRPAYYAKLKQALKPGGRLVNIDFHKRELPIGPPVAMKIAEADVIAELAAAGFRKPASLAILPLQYFLVFEPR